MLDQYKILFQDDDVEVLDAPEPAVDAEETTTYSETINDWPQNVYYAWVLYGAASYMCAIYWMQRFYFSNWFGTSTEYLSGKQATFTWFSKGESLNRLMLMAGWGMTAITWTVSMMRNEGIYVFFVMWARILHYLDVTRLVVTMIMKVLGMFSDSQEDYNVEDGLALDDGAAYAVSKEQRLTGTDWYMESFGLTVSFSLFGDLLGITEGIETEDIVAGLADATFDADSNSELYLETLPDEAVGF